MQVIDFLNHGLKLFQDKKKMNYRS
ncbi:uncharacterized protein METZ01_LOCUS247664 [marine metagenome]|uniref:Uncharacterized protein n=1 Tax=marine metagenome TaxID=408172 RepID=A0A382I572_9ZZZZ